MLNFQRKVTPGCRTRQGDGKFTSLNRGEGESLLWPGLASGPMIVEN